MKKRMTTSSKKKSKTQRKSKPPEASIDELLEAAESAMLGLDVMKAIPLFSSAVSLLRSGRTSTSITETRERQLIQVLEKLGECKVSIGDQAGAKDAFQEAISLHEQDKEAQESETKRMYYHETRASLYLYIGQLCMDEHALQNYQEGVKSLESCFALAQQRSQQSQQQNGCKDEIMDDDNHPQQDDELLSELGQKLSAAYCTMAELYLTDLCYEDNAESECEACLQKALKILDVDGHPMIDALQTIASVRLSQESKRYEAVQYILKAYSKMKTGTVALASLVGLGDDDEKQIKNDNENDIDQQQQKALELKEVDAASNLPEFEFRCQTAKLLLECAELVKGKEGESNSSMHVTEAPSQHQECVMAAISVLGSLLAQNDEVVEIWYLAGCAFCSKIPPAPAAARHYLQRSMEMLVDIQKGLKEEAQYAENDDEQQDLKEQLELNVSQMTDVQTKLDQLGDEDNMEE